MAVSNLKEILAEHKKWINNEGGTRANLRGADLRGAVLDFSCLPLWCGGSRFKCSPALIRQIFAHVSTLVCEDADDELKAAIDAIKCEAMKSHHARDLGLKGVSDD